MGGLVIDLDCDTGGAVFQNEVCKPRILINIVERILGIKISGFLRTKGIRKQINKQIFGRTAETIPKFV